MFSIIIVTFSALLLLSIGLMYILWLPEKNLNSDTNELNKIQLFCLLWNTLDENIFLLVALSLMAVVTFLLWQCDWFSNCTTGYQNFGLNGISDVVSILINWFIISTLLQRNEKRKYLPHRIAAYYDIAEMRHDIVYLWVAIYAS